VAITGKEIHHVSQSWESINIYTAPI